MKKPNKPEVDPNLREKALERFKDKKTLSPHILSDVETQKLIHELEVHQIELEMQSEEVERARAEAEAAANKYTELYDFAPTAFFTLSKDGVILSTNFAGSALFLTERKHLIGSNFAFYIEQGNRLIFDNFIKQLYETKDRFHCDFYTATGEFSPVFVHATGTLSDDDDNCLVSLVDISYRREVELQLKENAQFLDETQVIAELGTFKLDIASNTWTTSLVLNRILGIPSSYPKTAQSWVALVHPDWQKSMGEYYINEVLGKKNKFDKVYKIIRHDDKAERWVREIAELTLSRSDKPVALIGTLQDITERQQEQEEIKRKNAELLKVITEKDKFFSIIAHDLKSPLHGLMNLSELMATASEKFTIQEFSEASLLLHESAKNMYALLSNLLEWAMLQRDLISFVPKELLLTELVAECIEIASSHANHKSIEIRNEITSSQVAFGDLRMITTVLRNLISNAIKFTERGGRVTLTSEPAGNNMIEIAISDSGIGIPESIIDKIFILGERTGIKGTDDEPSTGLGLILCKEFVETNGGKIWINSREGNGCTVHFTIPEYIR